MISLTLQDIAKAIEGNLVNSDDANIVVDAVCTDTRKIQANCLFIALQGDAFDAHDFLTQAQQAGAKAVIIDREIETCVPAILVKDTRIALGKLSAYVKSKISGLKCAAITGSNGKTTTKELLSAILNVYVKQNDVAQVLATAGNFNNDIGLPLTLLRLTEDTAFAVVELGANHQGEIAYTSNLAQPDVALVNNVMPAHLEGFGSIEGVAKTKGEIWTSLRKEGTGVVNLDAKFAVTYIEQLTQQQSQIMTFSIMDSKATVFASDINFDELGYASFILNFQQQKMPITLNIAGKHNISNALAAASMAIALGCDLKTVSQGLSAVKEVAGRVNRCQVNENITLIDDTYNANSASLKAAIDLLQQCHGQKVLVFADMGELGKYSEEEHRDVGRYAATKDINNLFTVGDLTEFTHQSFSESSSELAIHFTDKQALMGYLETCLPAISNQKSTILVKGSRGTKMEEIVAFIKQLKIG